MDEYGLRLTKKMRARIDQLKDGDTTYKEVLITPDSASCKTGSDVFSKAHLKFTDTDGGGTPGKTNS